MRCTVRTMSGIICLTHVLCTVPYIQFYWHLFHSSVDIGDLTRALFPILWEITIPQSSNGPPSPQARPPKPAFSCGRSAISHRCVRWGVRILLGHIPWRLCRQGASTWLSVVICEVSVRCQVFPSIFYTYFYLE